MTKMISGSSVDLVEIDPQLIPIDYFLDVVHVADQVSRLQVDGLVEGDRPCEVVVDGGQVGVEEHEVGEGESLAEGGDVLEYPSLEVAHQLV